MGSEMCIRDRKKALVGKYNGSFRSQTLNGEITLNEDGVLEFAIANQSKSELEHTGENEFMMAGSKVVVEMDGDNVAGLAMSMNGRTLKFKPGEAKTMTAEAEENASNSKPDAVEPKEPKALPNVAPKSNADDLAVSSPNWPSFRGTGARGVADGQNAPKEWSETDAKNIAWKTPIPGLGLSLSLIHI